MATSNVTLIVNAAQAVNPLRQVTAETKKLDGATRDVNGRLRDAKGRFVGTCGVVRVTRLRKPRKIYQKLAKYRETIRTL